MHQPYKDEPRPLVRKMESIADLTSDERDAFRGLPIMVREIRAGQDIVLEGDRPSQPCLLLESFFFRYEFAGEDGRRQILAFHIPGEIPTCRASGS